MKKLIKLSLLTLAFPSMVLAQTNVIHGTVTSFDDNNTIPAATLRFQLLNSNVIQLKTDFDGVFSYTLPSGTYSVKIKAVGFQPTSLDLHRAAAT